VFLKTILVIFFYFVYILRLILSIPANIILSVLFLSSKKRYKIKEINIAIHNLVMLNDILDVQRYQTKEQNRKLNYLTIFFTLHPIIYIMLGYGDCLTHSYFVKWCYIKWCLENKKEIQNLRIVEIISIRPIIVGNHSFLYYEDGKILNAWTPYSEQLFYNDSDAIIYFETKFGNKYIQKLFSIA
jgi:hypothetical protein